MRTLKIGSHVGMSGKDMFLNSVKEALSYDANTFMVYTGAPQNTRRKSIEELNIDAAHALMKEHNIDTFVVHAPYIINPANTVNASTYELALDFLRLELERTHAMGSDLLILHPGSHVGAGVDLGINQTIACINQVFNEVPTGNIVLETMAGKGNEIGKDFNELARIYDGVTDNSRLRVCMDTCHIHDAGYDIVNNFDGVLDEFQTCLPLEQIAVMHINDSKNPCGAHKDRHANLGDGYIGFDAIYSIVHHPALIHSLKILETPYIPDPENPKKSYPPYKDEIAKLRAPL